MKLPSKRAAPGGADERFESMAPELKRRATPTLKKSIMGFGGISFNRIVVSLEPMLRSWVREEVERAFLSSFHPSSRSLLNQIEASRGRGLQLRFVNKLPSTIFTGSKVEAEDGETIRIILVDATTETMVSSGSLSSIKVEIVVLNGEFGTDEREDWTESEFNASVLRERQGKRPLVTGDLSITLVDGVGTVDNVIFTDNSSWIRSRKFRLGARIVQRISGESTIREATSEAFMVKDHRGELYKKHYPPFSHDEVWRLERIAKDGAFHKRLTSNNIFTVKEFLRLHVIDPSALRNVLGPGISNRVWDIIIDHALSCALDDDEWYSYYGTAQRVGLLLDSIYRVVAVTLDGENYHPVEKLIFSQKLLAEDAKRQAYKNVRDLVLVDRRATMGPSMPLTNLLPEPLSIPNLLLQQPDFSVENQDEPDTSNGNFYQSSTSYAYEMKDTNQLEDNSQAQMPICTSTTPAWGLASGPNISTSASESSVGIISPFPNVNSLNMRESIDVWPKARWLKLRAVSNGGRLVAVQHEGGSPLGGKTLLGVLA
ncbi:hypothetical protein V6N11_046875 [Hibiscus sabdariffa]|uniref:Calmodulin-binding protein n=1 Tax=Hibiscus sabdariffa TaxID=183260 RepID=A0ABR2NCM8_9ROSI